MVYSQVEVKQSSWKYWFMRGSSCSLSQFVGQCKRYVFGPKRKIVEHSHRHRYFHNIYFLPLVTEFWEACTQRTYGTGQIYDRNMPASALRQMFAGHWPEADNRETKSTLTEMLTARRRPFSSDNIEFARHESDILRLRFGPAAATSLSEDVERGSPPGPPIPRPRPMEPSRPTPAITHKHNIDITRWLITSWLINFLFQNKVELKPLKV